MVDVKNIRKSICQIGKLLYEKDLTDSSGGNISVKDEYKIYISPKKSGHDHQWNIEEDTIIVTDLCKIPLLGDEDMISREAASHYLIYQNFPDVNAVIHGHPFYMMAFSAAHMDVPAISEGTRAVLGNQPIVSIEEVMPGSIEQGKLIVEDFKLRRKNDPGCPLICGLPFHGSFSAGGNLNDAFMYTEVANNCARILIFRQIMFGNDPKADLTVHKYFTKEDFATIEKSKEVCNLGYLYKDVFGKETFYQGGNNNFDTDNTRIIIDSIVNEVLQKLK